VCGLVVEWAEPVVVAVAAVWVVPAFDPFEDGGRELVAAVPFVLVEELALESGEERFGDGVKPLTEAVVLHPLSSDVTFPALYV
jgi:hypothetical protein